ncbi:MAG: MoaD/ThiS family protein [Actinobacteria bacterium]|nr:MoaD/ThiS family protein [Actinomycetota bacterium]MBW3650738.1 MoaD/ThiS family protein [Actinomycetota bacterium]
MPVDVRLPTVLRQYAGGQSTVKANGTTVREVLDDLVLQFPQLQGQVVTEEGALHKFVNVYVDDDDIRYLDKLDTLLSGAETISILPAVAGG